MPEHMYSNFKVGDKVTLGVFPTDTPLDATVDGFYGEFVVIRFITEGFWLSVSRPRNQVAVSDANWYMSLMIVHPGNLKYRDK